MLLNDNLPIEIDYLQLRQYSGEGEKFIGFRGRNISFQILRPSLKKARKARKSSVSLIFLFIKEAF
jgi:hypothetical protein